MTAFCFTQTKTACSTNETGRSKWLVESDIHPAGFAATKTAGRKGIGNYRKSIVKIRKAGVEGRNVDEIGIRGRKAK